MARKILTPPVATCEGCGKVFGYDPSGDKLCGQCLALMVDTEDDECDMSEDCTCALCHRAEVTDAELAP